MILGVCSDPAASVWLLLLTALLTAAAAASAVVSSGLFCGAREN